MEYYSILEQFHKISDRIRKVTHGKVYPTHKPGKK